MSAGRGCVTWEIVPSYQRLNIDETARDNMGGRSMTPATLRHHVANISVTALLLAALSASATAQERNFKAASVKTPDGLTISAQDWAIQTDPKSSSSTVFRRAAYRGSSKSPVISQRSSTW